VRGKKISYEVNKKSSREKKQNFLTVTLRSRRSLECRVDIRPDQAAAEEGPGPKNRGFSPSNSRKTCATEASTPSGLKKEDGRKGSGK